MKPERWKQIEKLYQAVLERSPSERAAFLDEDCAGDEDLRRELESLLAHREQAASFMAAPVVDQPTGTLGDDAVGALGDEDSSMVGKTIAHYKILEKLGKGGMGEVWRARDSKLGREVAIKTLPEEFAKDEGRLARLEREARLLASLNHPNIATIHGLEEHEGTRFLVLELVEGDTLAERLKRGAIPVEESLKLALQIAEALEAAHEKGVIHRDLKPANVMVTADGKVKVLDFGLAKAFVGDHAGQDLSMMPTVTVDGTEAGRILGTPAYMSPEQVRGGSVDHRIDIWAFGCLLYELLTGRGAFRGESLGDTFVAIVGQEPEAISRVNPIVPEEMEQIVRYALRKESDSRYASAADVLADLERFRDKLVAEEIGTIGLWTSLRRSLTPRMAVPAILAVLGFLAITVWFLDRQADIRWAEEEALPEIARLVEASWRDYTDAYALAEQAEQYIPNHPELTELFSRSSLGINIRTEPAGADIYVKEYATPDAAWEWLGVSPIEDIRMPIGIFRWKLEKEGYETVLAAASTWDLDVVGENLLVPNDFVRALDAAEDIPEGMVRVPGAPTPAGDLDDFFIDRNEVTNAQYKEFVDGGGYRNREYWEHEFIRDGRTLTWEEAASEFVDQTGRPGPANWQAGDYPEGEANHPVSGVSWYEAAAYGKFVGKSLPTRQHWGLARGEATPVLQWPQLGGFAVFAPFSNFEGAGPVAAGSLPGVTSYGAYDMAGNVREWCWNDTPEGKLVRGGAWNDNTYRFTELSQAPAFERSPMIGFRCARYPDPETIPEAALAIVNFGPPPTFYEEDPVSDEVFQVYKEQFSYDPTDLNARLDSRDESHADWVHERILFDAAYGNEEVIAHLFLPRNTQPPYQTVVYVPGSAAAFRTSSDDISNYYEFPAFVSFLVKNGRAVLFPVYKGTFERRNVPHIPLEGDDSRSYTEFLIQVGKDFKRSVDYLETRDDIDAERLAYYGMSWGGRLGAIIPAVEERIRASVLLAGGLTGQGRPEANQLNYVTRVRTPTLMLNGRYDSEIPYGIQPGFDLLGTPDEHKELKLYETDHIPPLNEFIRETLAWLDRYLGPVR